MTEAARFWLRLGFISFVGPAILLLLSWIYVRYGSLPVAAGVLLGLKAAALVTFGGAYAGLG